LLLAEKHPYGTNRFGFANDVYGLPFGPLKVKNSSQLSIQRPCKLARKKMKKWLADRLTKAGITVK